MLTREEKRTVLPAEIHNEVWQVYEHAKNACAMLQEEGLTIEASRVSAIVHLLDQARRL